MHFLKIILLTDRHIGDNERSVIFKEETVIGQERVTTGDERREIRL